MPVALIFYDNLLIGSQLVNRLQDLGYRVQLVSDLETLARLAQEVKPMVFLTNLTARTSPVLDAIRVLRANTVTAHIPVLVFTKEGEKQLPHLARAAGATLVTSEAGSVAQLPQLLERALEVE